MKRQALFFGTFTAMMLALPAFVADGAPGMFEVRWGKNAFTSTRNSESSEEAPSMSSTCMVSAPAKRAAVARPCTPRAVQSHPRLPLQSSIE